MKNAKLIHTVISTIFILVVIYYLYLFFLDFNLQKLQVESVNTSYLILLVLLGISVRILYPYCWLLLIKEHGEVINNYTSLYYVFAKSWLARYIPGKVIWLAGKIYFASQQGIDKTTLTIVTGYEVGLQMLSSLFITVVFIILFGRQQMFDPAFTLAGIIAMLFLCFLMLPKNFNTVLVFSANVFGKKFHPRKNPNLNVFFQYFVTFCGIHVVSGLSFYLIAKAIAVDIPLEDYFFVTAIVLFSGIVGTLAVFVPSGLGVREGVQLTLLQGLIESHDLLLIVILTRIMSIVIDIVFFIACLICTTRIKNIFQRTTMRLK